MKNIIRFVLSFLIALVLVIVAFSVVVLANNSVLELSKEASIIVAVGLGIFLGVLTIIFYEASS